MLALLLLSAVASAQDPTITAEVVSERELLQRGPSPDFVVYSRRRQIELVVRNDSSASRALTVCARDVRFRPGTPEEPRPGVATLTAVAIGRAPLAPCASGTVEAGGALQLRFTISVPPLPISAGISAAEGRRMEVVTSLGTFTFSGEDWPDWREGTREEPPAAGQPAQK